MEKDITFESEGFRLAGTLSIPNSPEIPGSVLLVTGSGQLDRNENNKKFMGNTFNQIAHRLGEDGFASLRYDKRGIGASEGDYWRTGFYDHITDAAAGVRYMQSLPELHQAPIFLLGHSEGAVICARLAAEGVGAAGAILLAGTAQTGEATLRWQAGMIAKNMKGFNGFLIHRLHLDVLKAQDKALRKIKSSTRDWIRQGLVQKINARWMREFLAYDPTDDLKHIRIPVLALTGSKDIQVNPDDLPRMAEFVGNGFEYHIIPDMTHTLRAEKDGAGLSMYKQEIQRPLDPRLLDLIQDWLERQSSTRRVAGKMAASVSS
ncbi:MAG: alpha/beta hydrolase [Anaerolineales bacterium]|jgi:hypothetical protein